MTNVLVYGGAFDPIHWGHLTLASTVRQKLVVDEGVNYELWFVPSYYDTLGEKDLENNAHHRLEMLKLALKHEFSIIPDTLICTIEFESKSKMGTYEMLCQLRNRFPKYEFKFLMGADAGRRIDQWRNSRKLRREFKMVVSARNIEHKATWGKNPTIKRKLSAGMGWIWDRPGQHITIEDAPLEKAISSTAVKELVRENKWKELKELVPGSVLKYIRDNGLYMEEQHGPDAKSKSIHYF